ncbi:hypothetical protein VM1G_01260 [Cytospora mali]|uniref:Uncharacterized protein n=1 Tax=Cytospora mali TaxID=578113 RepID=A0A194VL05_CYTMA|nr:hypothetical protein VM1G_01260 [Valsa mali]
MAPKQKTFELIPDPVGLPGQAQHAGAVISKPPMTTKQAKKLYRQRNKGPKLSKAEQRRIELMEQDRIRKEFEKEKAQARARTARERKKEKEEKEKEARRRKGLPLVDIHPSQGTISNFISRLAFGRKPGSNGAKPNLETVQETKSETVTEEEPETDTDGEDTHVENNEEEASEKENQAPRNIAGGRPAKRRRLTQSNNKLLDRMIHIPSQRTVGAVARVAQELETESRSRASSVDVDDPATETMLEDQLVADVELASSKSMANSSPIKEVPVKEAASSHVLAPKLVPAAPTVPPQTRPLPPSRPSPKHQEPQPPRSPMDSNLHQKPKTAVSNHVRAHHGEGIFKKPTSPYVPHLREKTAIKSPAIGVPSVPPKFKAPAEPQNSNFARPKFLPRHIQAPNPIPVQASPTYAGSRRSAIEVVNAVPTSTQLLVMNHADELFPSASQEAQELYEDQPPVDKARTVAGPSSLVRNSPKTIAKAAAAPSPGTESREREPFIQPQQNQPPPPGGAASLDFPFLSTQDFVLSSQDMMELATPSKGRQVPKFQAARPTARGETLSTKRWEGLSAGKQLATELQAVIESKKKPALPSTTNPRKKHDLNGQRSTSDSGDVRGIKEDERMKDTKVAAGCPKQVYTSSRPQCLVTSGDRRQALQPASRTRFTPRESRGKAVPGDESQGSKQASAHAPLSCHSLSSAKPTQTDAFPGPTDAVVTSQASPPKKRMFGSSGPGAEVLIAMERSYRENLQEKRRREEELQKQARKPQATRQREIEQLAGELADIIDNGDELSDGWMSEKTPPRQPTHTEEVGAIKDLHQTSSGKPDGKTEIPASQETDYGDFDFDAGDELGVLIDMAWVDDDLDGF